MRILAILSRVPFPLTDGGAILSYNTLKHLHKAGHDVHVLTLNTKKHHQSPDVLRDIAAWVQTLDIDTDIHASEALQSLLRGESYIAKRFESNAFAKMLQNTLQTSRFDIIHLDHTLTGWYAHIAQEALQGQQPAPKVVLRTHNVEYTIQERLAKHEQNALRKWYRKHEAKQMKKVEKRIFAECDGVVAITPEDAAIIRQMGYSGALEVIPAGADTTEFTRNPDIQRLPKTLCYIGGMDWLPNVEAMRYFVREVMPLVRETMPKMALHIAGKRMTDEVRNFANERGVFVHPDVPSASVFLQAHEILVVPLLSGGGMRLKIVEAMALGIPIISTRIGAEGVNVRDGENILFAETPQEFLVAIQTLSNDDALRERLGANARKTALEQYTWEAVVKRQIAFYERLCSRQ